MKRRIAAVLLTAAMVLTISGCGGNTAQKDNRMTTENLSTESKVDVDIKEPRTDVDPGVDVTETTTEEPTTEEETEEEYTGEFTLTPDLFNEALGKDRKAVEKIFGINPKNHVSSLDERQINNLMIHTYNQVIEWNGVEFKSIQNSFRAHEDSDDESFYQIYMTLSEYTHENVGKPSQSEVYDAYDKVYNYLCGLYGEPYIDERDDEILGYFCNTKWENTDYGTIMMQKSINKDQIDGNNDFLIYFCSEEYYDMY